MSNQTETARATDIKCMADEIVDSAREACDLAATQDNIPDSIVADFARRAAQSKSLRDAVFGACEDDLDVADDYMAQLELVLEGIDNELVAADVRVHVPD